MSDPTRKDPPPVPGLSQGATGEWSSTPPPLMPNSPTLTGSGVGLPPDAFGIPNPFGRYEVSRLLGRGGMGAVFLAQDTQLERPVALKIPTFRGSLSATQKERFFREAKSIAALRHPNICPVFDVDEYIGVLYLTLAYIEGQTLDRKLRDDGPMPARQAAELLRRVAIGMQAAHEHGTIHRDLKPANIMIDLTGEPVIMDFGLARRGEWDEEGGDEPTAAKSAGLTLAGAVIGTPAYMPPEQARGDHDAVGPTSDVYSLGAILFECLTGQRPYGGGDANSTIARILKEPTPDPVSVRADVDPALAQVCRKAMAKKPEDRYQSMTELAEALQKAIEPELRVVEPPPLPNQASAPTAPRKPKRRRWVKIAGCLGFFLAMIAICVGGPLLAVRELVERFSEFAQKIQENQEKADAEWTAINNYWVPPAESADDAALFPTIVGDRFRRKETRASKGDVEFGLTFPGRTGIYTSPNGSDIEVTAFPRTEELAKADVDRIERLLKPRSGIDGETVEARRMHVPLLSGNSGLRSVTYSATLNDEGGIEYGKLWFGRGWLFFFRCVRNPRIGGPKVNVAPTKEGKQISFDEETVSVFAPKYLTEVGKMAASKPK